MREYDSLPARMNAKLDYLLRPYVT